MADVIDKDTDKITRSELALILKAFASSAEADLRQLDNRILNLSEALAIKQYGADQVAEACRAAGDKLGSFADAGHPYEALMVAYKTGKLL